MALMNSFDSKVNRDFRTNLVLLEIKKSHLVNTPHTEGKDIYFVTDADLDVSPFQHPLYDADEDIVYLDVRGYSILDRNGSFRLKGDLDSELLLLRAKLELAWVHGTANELFTAFSFSNDVYVRWLTETLTREFSLNPAQDTQLKVLIALFNIGQYYNSITEPALITRYYRLISQQYYVDMDTVQEIASRLTQTFPRDIAEFVAAIKEANISTRMANINEVSILNVLGGAWFMTAQPTLVVGLGLEYPPAFAAMVTMALNYRLFKKTSIGGVVDRLTKGSKKEDHIRALKYLFDRTVGEPHPGKYKRAYGMEQYPINAVVIPDFESRGIGAEGIDWDRVLTAVAAGTLAGVLTFGIIKFVEWITGLSVAGGGGGAAYSPKSDSLSSKADRNTEDAEQVLRETAKSIIAANEAQKKIGQTNGPEFENVLKKMSKSKKKPAEDKPTTKPDDAPAAASDDSYEIELEKDEREAFDHRKAICEHFRGEDQIAALAIFNELCTDHKFGGTGEHSIKDLAQRLIDIDKKTALFKDGNYTFCMMMAGGWLRLQSIFTLSLASRQGIQELDGAVTDFESSWKQVIDTVDKSIKAIEDEGDAAIPKLEKMTEFVEAQLIELKKHADVSNAMLEQAMEVGKIDDQWKETMSEKPLEAIRNVKDIHKKHVTNRKLYVFLGRYEACVKEREGKLKAIVDAAGKVDSPTGQLKVEAAKLSSAIGRTLTAMAGSFRFISNACKSYDIVMQNYLDAATRISRGIEKLRKTYEKEAKD